MITSMYINTFANTSLLWINVIEHNTLTGEQCNLIKNSPSINEWMAIFIKNIMLHRQNYGNY